MNAYPLFPTLVCEDTYNDNEHFKKIFFANVFNHMKDGMAGEATGHVDIHLDTDFEDLFKFVGSKAKHYVGILGIDPEIFDFNLVKTWLNVIKESDNPTHDHADAHLSFAYYVNVPEDVDKRFVVYRPHETNSLYHGMLNFNIQQYNEFNSTNFKFTPEEGKLFLFPSKLKHSVTSPDHFDPIVIPETKTNTVEELKTKRICIAGDFLLTHKNKSAQFLGLQPVKNWRNF